MFCGLEVRIFFAPKLNGQTGLLSILEAWI
jgi:hypothetical protein